MGDETGRCETCMQHSGIETKQSTLETALERLEKKVDGLGEKVFIGFGIVLAAQFFLKGH